MKTPRGLVGLAEAGPLAALIVTLAAAGGCGGTSVEVQTSSSATTSDPLNDIEPSELFRRGVVLAQHGDFVRAEQYLLAARNRGFDEGRVIPPLMEVCVRASRLSAAIGYAEPYLESHPSDWPLRVQWRHDVIPKEVYEETLLSFLAPVRPFLDDPKVSEIMINGPNQIFIEKAGKLTLTDARFPSMRRSTPRCATSPSTSARWSTRTTPSSRPACPTGRASRRSSPRRRPTGPTWSIRRFFKETLTVQRLVDFGSLTTEAAQVLECLVVMKQNVVVAGGTGSGKTSMLNALSSFIPDGERIVIIEDSREVQLQRQHVVQLEARPGDAKGRGKVSIRDLFRATLRMRPDRIVVGEIRGGEALDLVQAMTSGHGGCITTVHATYPHDTLTRLETMSLMSDVELPLSALRVQLGSAINLVVQTSRLQDGSRKVTHVSEVRGYNPAPGSSDLRPLELSGFSRAPRAARVSDRRLTSWFPFGPDAGKLARQ
jgi:pilus assembly protein CpaF